MLPEEMDYMDIREKKNTSKDLTEGYIRLIFSPSRLGALQGDELFFFS